ncbi:MAG: right-handed parallel beta-helix repeat-containing protein [Planctomycetota bacterium]
MSGAMKGWRRIVAAAILGALPAGAFEVPKPDDDVKDEERKLEVRVIDRNQDVAEDIIVKATGKLVIKPGVTLKFAAGKGLVARGVVEAVGTRDKPVVFAARDETKGWANVALLGNDTRGSRFEWCRFSGGRGCAVKFTAELEYEKLLPWGDKEGGICGGAMFLTETDKVEIRSCRFEKNAAVMGGAICCWGQASPTIEGNLFVDNMGVEDAGAIHAVLLSSPAITGNYFIGNAAKYGGALHCLHRATPEIKGNYIAKNKALSAGGGLSFFNASPNVEGNFVAENAAEKEGGGANCAAGAKPVLSGNFIGENTDPSGDSKGLKASGGDPEKKIPPASFVEEDMAKKADVLEALKKAGVMDLPERLK